MEQITIAGSLKLQMSEVGELESEESMDAMKAAIADQMGVDLSTVASVEITIKVKGEMPMTVADPVAFAASPEAKAGIEIAIADQNNVTAEDVTATITVVDAGRRLQSSRRLQSNVDVSFEIAVENGAAADAMTSEMASDSFDMTALAAAVNVELAATSPDLQVTSVESVTAAPEVTVSYTIVTEDAEVAADAEEAVNSADPDLMTASINEQLEDAGVEVTVAVTEISAPVRTVEVMIADTPAPAAPVRTSGASGASFAAAVGVLVIAGAAH